MQFFLSFLIAIYLITSPIKSDISILENDETISCESSPINTFSYLIPDSWNNCVGTITFKDFDYVGDMYTGEFKQGKLHGKGNYYYKADNKFKGDRYKGEFKEAKYSADQINVELIHKSISFEEFRSIISEYSFLQDDLIGDEVGIPLYFLGKLTKTNGLKVVQVGEGADELFYGYEHWLRFAKLYKSIPKFNSISSQNNFKSHRANLLFNIIQNSNPFPGGAIGFNLAQIKELVEFDFTDNSNLINYSDNLWKDYLSRENFSITKWMTLIDLKIRLPELLLMRMDKLSMQSGVEARVPFLDHRIVEFVLSLPENIIFDLNRTKPLLKDLSTRHIPDKVLSRRKQGFRAPISNWIQKDPDYFFDKIHEFNLNYNFFEPAALSRTLKDGDIQKIWYIYNLSSWHLSRITK